MPANTTDDAGSDPALEEAVAFAQSFVHDGGAAAVREQAAALPADIMTAWNATRDTVVSHWEAMIPEVLTVLAHLKDRTTYEPEGQEALLRFGYHLQTGVTALNAFGSRFSKDDIEWALAAPPGTMPAAGGIH